jgi:hypothetical protein
MARLFKTTADIKGYAAIHKAMSFDSLTPYIDAAEIEYIKPLLGDALYAALVASYNGTIASPYIALLPYVQRPLAYYTIYNALPFLNATISDMGVQEQQSREGTSTPARQWAYEQLRRENIRNADLFAEDLLAFLEANKSTYTTWATDTTKTKALFVDNSTTLGRMIGQHSSRRLYLAIKPYLLQAEEQMIVPATGQDLYDDFKTKHAAGTLSATVIKHCQRIAAYYAMYLAYDFLQVEITTSGLSVSSYNDGVNNKAVAAAKGKAQERYYNQAVQATRIFKEYLDVNYADNELYETELDSDEPFRYYLPDNTGKTSFMV